MPTQEEKTHAMLNWFLGIILGIIAPVIFMLIDKDKPFVYRNAMQALTFHIGIIILWVITGILAVITCGFGVVLYVVPWLAGIIFCIMGGIAANNGNVYEPPVTAQLAKKWFNV